MKKYLFTLIFVTNLAYSGFDSVDFNYTINSNTKEQAIKESERVIPLILSGKIKVSLHRHCHTIHKNDLIFRHAKIKKMFKYKGENLIAYYQMNMSFRHKRCVN